MAVVKKDGFMWGTGRRKSAIARVRLSAGKGAMTVNGLPFEKYFVTHHQRGPLFVPFETTDTKGKFDADISVLGGGKQAQAEAVVLGLSRALLKANAEFAAKLKGIDLLTRDSRMKERKKYGRHGARRGTQFSKR